ncbi:glycosyltransferase [Maricaulis sp. CAU 1757]
MSSNTTREAIAAESKGSPGTARGAANVHLSASEKRSEVARGSKARPQRSVVLILGMHRSGTSAITRLLNICGLALPDRLIEAQEDNALGFWEPEEIVKAHDAYLDGLGLQYDSLKVLPRGFEADEGTRALIAKIQRVVQSVPGRKPVVLKDPRIARLLPVWRKAMEEIGVSLKVVIIVRNPLEVARSLDRRSQFSYEKSFLLWMIYNRELELNSRGLSRVFVTYESLLEDWKAQVQRIAAALRLSSLRVDAAAAKEVKTFLRPDMRHQQATDEDLVEEPRAFSWVQSLYWSFREAANGGTEVDDSVDKIYADAGPAIDVLGQVIDDKDSDVYQLATKLNSKIKAAEDSAGAKALAEVTKMREEVLRVQYELHEKELQRELAVLRDEYEAHLQAARQEKDEVTRSYESQIESEQAERASAAQEYERVLEELREEKATAARNYEQALEEVRAEKAQVDEALRKVIVAEQQERARADEEVRRSAALRVCLDQQEQTCRDLEARVAKLGIDLDAERDLAKQHAAERDRAVAEAKQHAAERDRAVAEAKQHAAERDRAVAEAKQHAAERGGAVVEVKQHAAERDRAVAEAKQHAAERDRAVAEAKQHAAERDREVAERLEWERRAEWLADTIRSGRGFGWKLRKSLMGWGPVGRFLVLASGLYSPALLARPDKMLRLFRQSEAIRKSALFDALAYLEGNWDVRAAGEDPVLHYIATGAAEGRNPGTGFDTRFYRDTYADVRASGLNPLYHYLEFGREEGRLALPPQAELEYDPLQAVLEPYAVRPDDVVAPEIHAGEAFLDRFGLLGEEPDFAGAVSALNSDIRKLNIVDADATEQPDVSIIVPVYGQLPYTLNCLDSLRGQASRYTAEIIVYDDCSPDMLTREFVSQVEGVRFIRASENGGFIQACNSAAEHARGRFLIMLNNDTRVVPGWLDSLIGSFDTFPNAGLVGSKLFYPDGSLQEAGGIVWRDGSAWNYGRNDDPNKPEYCHARQADYCSGASIAIPADLWRNLGGFDGNTYERAYYEDTDLAFRVREAGFETWFQALSRVVHYEGKTSGTDEAAGEKAYQASNRERFLKRWLNTLGDHRENGEKPWREAVRANGRMALLLDATTPTPDKDSGSLDVINLITMLRELGYGVCFAPEDNMLFYGEYTRRLQEAGVQCLYHPYCLPLEPFLEQNGQEFDVIVVHRLEPTRRWLEKLRRYCPHAKIVYNTVDLHHIRDRREAELKNDKALLERAQEIEKVELELIERCDATIVVSSVEQEALKRINPRWNVTHLPLIREVPGSDKGFADRGGIVFVGGFAHQPNSDAVHYFAEEIWPEIRRRMPDCTFRIIGSRMSEDIRQLKEIDGIEPIGFVEDLKPVLNSARLMVAPLRFGAGAKGKVISSLSHGLPCVATSIAAEGMFAGSDEGLFVADDPHRFAELVEELYHDEDRWAAASSAAVAFAQRKNSLQEGLRILREDLGVA